jgi:predicted aconitase with swiveling domain
MLHEMRVRGVVPLALVFNSVNPIIAQGTALADLPMLAGFDGDITAALRTGDRLELLPDRHLLRRLEATARP